MASAPCSTAVSTTAPISKKKKYVAPKLIEYGSTAKLSANKPGSVYDGTSPLMMG